MAEPIHNLSMEDITRIFRAVNFVEKLSREPFNRNSVAGFGPAIRRPMNSESCAVEVTGEVVTSPPEDEGLYPGIMHLPDPTVLPPWKTAVCWIRGTPGQTLNIGARGVGRLIGVRVVHDPDETRIPVYVLACCDSEPPYPAPPEPVSGGTPCVTWYTSYLHLGWTAVREGDLVRPEQFIGNLGPYSNGAHLHFSLGDGDQSQNPVAGAITAGVATDLEGWISDLGYPIVGTHVGVLPSPLADFSAEELAVIEERFAFPLDDDIDWQAWVSSPLHTGWDYYGLDFLIPGADHIGAAVYAAFTGDDVTTTCTYAGYTEGVGWVVILKHQYGECEEESGSETIESVTPQPVTGGLTINSRGQTVVLPGFGLKIVKGKLVIDADALCVLIECCDATTLELEAEADVQVGLAPLDVSFTAAASGGVVGDGYTYYWDFGDGLYSELQNPTHTYEEPGLYVARVTVVDRCNRTVEVAIPVAVGEECGCPSACPDGLPTSINFELAGGTGHFEGANGAWELFHIGGCLFGWHQHGWTAVGGITGVTLTHDDGHELTYAGVAADPDDCCAGGISVVLAHSVGEGDEPALFVDEIGTSGACDPCCVTEPTPGVCCDVAPDDLAGDGLPNSLTVVITTTIPGLSGTYAVTRASGFGAWTRSGGTSFENPSLSLGCTGGSYALVIGATCEDEITPFGATLSAAPSCCDPFQWTGSGSTNTGCYAATLISARVYAS